MPTLARARKPTIASSAPRPPLPNSRGAESNLDR